MSISIVFSLVLLVFGQSMHLPERRHDGHNEDLLKRINHCQRILPGLISQHIEHICGGLRLRNPRLHAKIAPTFLLVFRGPMQFR